MGGPIRVDWQAIKSRWASQYQDAHLFVLPKGFAQLVLAIQERLHWEATYRVEGYDFSDWDELQALVDLGLAGLTDSIMLQDLLAQVQSVEDAIFATACCPEVDWTNGGAFTDPVDEGVGLVPQPVVDSGYSTDTADWDGYGDYKCDAAHVLIDSAIALTNRLAAIAELLDSPLAIAGIVAAIAGAAGAIVTGGLTLVTGILVSVGTAGSIWGLLLDLAGGAGFADIVADLEAARDDLACAIVQGDGVGGTLADLLAAIDANVTLSALVGFYPWEQWIRTLYAGRYAETDFAQGVADSGRFGSTCCQITPPAGNLRVSNWFGTGGDCNIAPDDGSAIGCGDDGPNTIQWYTRYRVNGDGAGHFRMQVDLSGTRLDVQLVIHEYVGSNSGSNVTGQLITNVAGATIANCGGQPPTCLVGTHNGINRVHVEGGSGAPDCDASPPEYFVIEIRPMP